MNLPDLNPLLMSELRLSIMSMLYQEEEVDFLFIKEVTKASAGNISVQIDKLAQAKYIEVEKGFKGKRTRTVCKITPIGRKAFEDHYESLKQYFK